MMVSLPILIGQVAGSAGGSGGSSVVRKWGDLGRAMDGEGEVAPRIGFGDGVEGERAAVTGKWHGFDGSDEEFR